MYKKMMSKAKTKITKTTKTTKTTNNKQSTTKPFTSVAELQTNTHHLQSFNHYYQVSKLFHKNKNNHKLQIQSQSKSNTKRKKFDRLPPTCFKTTKSIQTKSKAASLASAKHLKALSVWACLVCRFKTNKPSRSCRFSLFVQKKSAQRSDKH